MNTWSPAARYLTFILVILALAFLGWHVRALFHPLITALLISYIMNPLVQRVQKWFRLSRTASVNLVYFLTLTLLLGLPAILIPIFFQEIQDVGNDLVALFLKLRSELSRAVIIAGIRVYPGQVIPDLSQAMDTLMSNVPKHALEWLKSTSRGLAWMLVMVVAVYYLLRDGKQLHQWIIQQAPPAYRKDLERLYWEIRDVWNAYLQGQLKLMLIVGVVFTLVWLAIGLPGAFILGFLTGLFSLIPEIGPLAATLLAVGVALVEGSTYLPISNFWFAMLVIAIYLVLINLKNIWLRPRILGESVKMNHGVVFIAIIAAVIFWGILGALIIVPVLASAGILWRYLRNRIWGLPPFSGFPPLKPSAAGGAATASTEKATSTQTQPHHLASQEEKT